MELTKKQAEWLPHVEACARSSDSIASYAREHDLELSQLYFYRSVTQAKQIGEASEVNPRFTQVVAPSASPGVHVQLANGVRLLLPGLTDPQVLERLAAL